MSHQEMQLTAEQEAVANHPHNVHARVLAGPGTGKSATAVALVKRLLTSIESGKPRVKFITFTRAATAELAEKLKATQATVEHPSTLHSFAAVILSQNPGAALFPTPLRIPSDQEEVLIKEHIARLLHLPRKKVELLLGALAAKWETLEEKPIPGITDEEKARFTGMMNQHQRIFRYTLRQQLPDLFRTALRDHDDLKGVDYDLLIVDEYQDLNACDLEILQRLATRGITIMGFGDDDQSIYSFRHANPEGIRRFLKDYSNARDYSLTICHRCGSSIISWAQHVIHGSTQQQPLKKLQAVSADSGWTALWQFKSAEREAEAVATMVQRLHVEKGLRYPDILILTRTDHQGRFSKPIKERLMARGIPLANANEVNKVILANLELLSVLRLIDNNRDSLAWWTLLNNLRGVGLTFINHIYNAAEETGTTFGEVFVAQVESGLPQAPASGKINAINLYERISQFFKAAPAPGKSVAWGKWITDSAEAANLPAVTPELKTLLLKIDDVTEEDCTLNRYISQIIPLGKDIMHSHGEGVRFMTMASSKGLTVEATIVVGVENDLMPNLKLGTEEEERRLLYVAMTRARKYLLLTWVARRKGSTARAGRVNVWGRRQHSQFLQNGPVESQQRTVELPKRK